jgi:hypothetical protein
MLPALLNAPKTPLDWQRWSFDNRTSHDAIRAGILAKGGPNLADLVLDPIDFADWRGWLLRHALTHEQMDAALGVQSTDLSVLDLNDAQAVESWIGTHQLEHYDAELLAGAAS